jgi:hypothetical protein
MATVTLGTNAQTTLTAIKWDPSMSAADFATIANGILDDYYQGTGLAPTPPASPRIYPGAFQRGGMYAEINIPNRGQLIVKPGDYVGIDGSGWPILVSSFAITRGGTSWTHT